MINARESHVFEKITKLVDDRAEELVALTMDLIRFPTINPPGEAYIPCARFIGDRLKKRGFDVQYMRAFDTPGDSNEYPRTRCTLLSALSGSTHKSQKLMSQGET